jgi:hypothetical protein
MSDTPSMYVQVTRTGLAAMDAEIAALRESAKAAERKGMERAASLDLSRLKYEPGGYENAIEDYRAAIRAAMEETR